MAAPLAAASRCLRVATGASAAVATLLRRYGNFDIALRLFRTDFSASRRPACDALSRCAYFSRADWYLQSNGMPDSRRQATGVIKGFTDTWHSIKIDIESGNIDIFIIITAFLDQFSRISHSPPRTRQ